MAWGSKSKVELIAELATSQTEVRLLREMIESKDKDLEVVRLQLKFTQEALIAKEAPEAYTDHKIEQDNVTRELTPEELKRQQVVRAQMEADRILLEEMESPLFKNAEDMQQILSRGLIRPPESLHGDDES